MRRLAVFSMVLLAGWSSARADALLSDGARVKSVKIYPEGAYVTLSLPVSLKAGVPEKVVFPDLWYADQKTIEIRALSAATDSLDLVSEISSVMPLEHVGAYREVSAESDSVWAKLERLRADSLVQEREIDFLQANARQEGGSVERLAELSSWMRQRYADIYNQQRQTREAIKKYEKELTRLKGAAGQIDETFSSVTQVAARLTANKSCTTELELSYYTTAARWNAFYFFRFSPKSQTAELEYQAELWQWTGFDWNGVSAELCYGEPDKSIVLPHTYVSGIRYQQPLTREQRKKIPEEGPMVNRVLGYATNVRTIPSATETSVSYRLTYPLTLESSESYKDRNLKQMVPVRKDTVEAVFDYMFNYHAPVYLAAHIADWRSLNLFDGQMSVFCDGRMLGQTDLFLYQVGDTLSVPLMQEPRVTVNRTKVKDYETQVRGAKTERQCEYELRVRNNQDFPIRIRVRDQYPVSSTDEVQVTLTETSGAKIDSRKGALDWTLELRPGAERVLKFGYSVRYPKGGTVSF